MTHILVHLVKEIDILRPVFLHNMFPFERFMAVLKNMFIIVLILKEASLVAMEQRSSLSLMLTLLMILNRLEFLNHGTRGEYVERAH
jgi:hypothetical protein